MKNYVEISIILHITTYCYNIGPSLLVVAQWTCNCEPLWLTVETLIKNHIAKLGERRVMRGWWCGENQVQ